MIKDWETFHSTCKSVFGFPDFYGQNMNAWIDCLTYLDEGDGMSNIHLSEGESLGIEVVDAPDFKARLPDVFEALVECTASVNERYAERGSSTRVLLTYSLGSNEIHL